MNSQYSVVSYPLVNFANPQALNVRSRKMNGFVYKITFMLYFFISKTAEKRNPFLCLCVQYIVLDFSFE